MVSLAVLLIGLPSGMAQAGDDRPNKPRGVVVDAVTDFDVETNESLELEFYFDPGRVNVKRGKNITFVSVNESELPDEAVVEPHTATIVKRSELPKTVAENFNCFDSGPCSLAAGHVDENFEPVPGQEIIDVGAPGLNTRGDSLFIPPNGEITATVNARRGKTLYYLCAIHPWMQGKIRVR